MPQPLSKVRKSATVSVSADYIQEHPDFAKAVAGIVALWAHSDGNLAAILSFMMKTDIRTGVAMFQALNSAEARRASLLAAAENALNEWEAILLKAVLKVNSASRRQRNDFAHGVWGKAAELEDAILLMDPAVVMNKNVSHRQVEVTAEGSRIIQPKGLDSDKIMVYRKPDFDRALEEAETAYARLVYFYYLVGYRDERARTKLLNDPLVQQAAAKLSHESSPEVQALLRPPAPGEAPPKGYKVNAFVSVPDL